VSTIAAFLLAAVGAYTLERVMAVNIALAVAVVVMSRGRLRFGPPAPRPGWSAVIPALLAAGGAWMYFSVPASEYVLGGRDPGVYMNEGIQIAQRRSLVTTDAIVPTVPASARDLFFPSHKTPSYYSIRFMGFHLRDPETGTVSGQFPQGYPMWIAMAYGIDGLTGTRRVAAWWAILGVLAVYFAGARLIGPVPAAAAAGLLTVHVIQTWYARYPNSEIVTQALLFAGLHAHAYAHEAEDRFFGPVAASLLGLALFTRLPVIIGLATALAASLLQPASRDRRFGGTGYATAWRSSFVWTLALWTAAAGVYYTTQLGPYFDRPIAYWGSLSTLNRLLLAAAGATVFAISLAVRRPSVAAVIDRWLPIALTVVVVPGGIYALLFREAGGLLAPQDAYSVREFARLYFTPLAFGLALAGYALTVWKSFWRAPALILTITAYALFFFYKLRIFPENFWLARRYLDVILPGALLFAAAAALLPLSRVIAASWASRRTVEMARLVAGVVMVALVAQNYVHASSRIRTHVEYAGLIPILERLAGRFGDADLVLFEAREASDVHVLALPLAYIYARNVLVLDRSRPDKAAVSEFFRWARDRYKNVYFIAGGGTDLLTPGVGAETVSIERFQIPEYQRTGYDTYPQSVPQKPFDFTIYRLVEAPSTPPPQSLDIGGADDLSVLDFHPKERLGGGRVTFRWTQDSSYLVMGIRPQNREVVLRLSSGRPRGAAGPDVSVSIDGRLLGNAAVTSDFHDYVFPIPRDFAMELAKRDGAPQIRIQSPTWSPSLAMGGTDNRALGVMLDRAEIR
jgi:hypothetical protein